MSYWYGSLPILYYPLGSSVGPGPGPGFLLITDGTNFLMTDNTPLKLAGS